MHQSRMSQDGSDPGRGTPHAYRVFCDPVHQRQSSKTVHTKIRRAVAIGLLAPVDSPQGVLAGARPIWGTPLRQMGVSDWFSQPAGDDGSHGPIEWSHPLFEWFTPPQDTTGYSVWWSRICQQLDRLQLAVYTAPTGWRRYPTMTSRSAKWVDAISYTARGARRLHTQPLSGIRKPSMTIGS
ncbi:unnamed protein product [Phytophthora fragariaefolia]|uniref:Unnamed protein product n=1 Tax=Phytophthora fragariaefolia TaxID=1490495 RepID=A0A9W6TZ38_9STRA|nr:unnamed protein product [Phytophthora fragariaefolia]